MGEGDFNIQVASLFQLAHFVCSNPYSKEVCGGNKLLRYPNFLLIDHRITSKVLRQNSSQFVTQIQQQFVAGAFHWTFERVKAFVSCQIQIFWWRKRRKKEAKPQFYWNNDNRHGNPMEKKVDELQRSGLLLQSLWKKNFPNSFLKNSYRIRIKVR